MELRKEHVVQMVQVVGLGAAAIAPHVLLSVAFISIAALATLHGGGFEIGTIEELEGDEDVY